uniref:SERPIN domain-containing protein n=1 Tax=Globodera pallida TaxID=36090 RepID=A0A183CAX9_GLOPA
MPTIATVVLLGLAVQFDGCKANETPSGDAVGQADFAVDLLKAVYRNRAESEPAKNTVLSPLSAAIALAMAYAGARGQTAAEFGKVLAGDSSASTLHHNFANFFMKLRPIKPMKQYKLRIANRVYLANTFKVLEQFKSVINAHYGGNFESIDFAQNVAAAKKINAFVENSTNGKIKDLIKSRDLNSLTNRPSVRLFLIDSQKHVMFSGVFMGEQ